MIESKQRFKGYLVDFMKGNICQRDPPMGVDSVDLLNAIVEDRIKQKTYTCRATD
jgi:hypothetical protein